MSEFDFPSAFMLATSLPGFRCFADSELAADRGVAGKDCGVAGIAGGGISLGVEGASEGLGEGGGASDRIGDGVTVPCRV